MMPILSGPYVEIAQCRCPDCHELITSQTRFGGQPYTRIQIREEYLPVRCSQCGFNWSLLGKNMLRLVQLDFTEWRAAA
jgi:hypothetical protein